MAASTEEKKKQIAEENASNKSTDKEYNEKAASDYKLKMAQENAK